MDNNPFILSDEKIVDKVVRSLLDHLNTADGVGLIEQAIVEVVPDSVLEKVRESEDEDEAMNDLVKRVQTRFLAIMNAVIS